MTRALSLGVTVFVSSLLCGCPKPEAGKSPAEATEAKTTPSKTASNKTPAADAAKATFDPPEGLRWPVALTKPPASLSGMPVDDQAAFKRLLGLVRLAAQAKARMLNGLVARTKKMNKRVDLKAMQAAYEGETNAVQERLRAERPPPNLAPLRDQLVGALTDQQVFFKRAVAEAAKGRNLTVILESVPEATHASKKLQTGYLVTKERYPKWTDEVGKSLRSHLKILDIR